MNQDIATVMLSTTQIQEEVRRIGTKISKDYETTYPVLLCVLKGAAVFLSDLIRNITIPIQLDYVSISSYGSDTTSSGKISLRQELSVDIKNRDVIIVEDIVDSGLSLQYLKEYLEKYKPNSIKTCVLLDKPDAHKIDISIDYHGFFIGNDFVVGYGLDYAEKYRNLPYIGVLKKEIYS